MCSKVDRRGRLKYHKFTALLRKYRTKTGRDGTPSVLRPVTAKTLIAKESVVAFNLKTKIWQTGALEWWGFIDNDDVFLGSREFPLPPEEGDEWTVRATGDQFKIIDGEICKIGHQPPKDPLW